VARAREIRAPAGVARQPPQYGHRGGVRNPQCQSVAKAATTQRARSM